MMNSDIAILVGIILYLVGAIRTFAWMKKKRENEAVNHILGRPSTFRLLLACIIGWLFFELVMVWLWHDEKIKKGFDEQYELCPTCKGSPIVFNYRPFWEYPYPKSEFKCPECGGIGIVRKND